MKIDLSLAFVAYNEKDNISKCLLSALNAAKKIAYNYEIIAVVHENSSDGTIGIVKELAKKNKNIRLVIQKKTDPGVGRAYGIAIENAKYPFVFYSDADNQFDLQEILKLAKHIENNDIVAGFRKKRADKFGRIFTAGVYNLIIQTIFGMNEKDFDCAFRIVRKDMFSKINLHTTTGFIAPEMMIKAKIAGFRIMQVPVKHLPRTANEAIFESSISPFPKLKIVINQIKEMIRVWREVYRI